MSRRKRVDGGRRGKFFRRIEAIEAKHGADLRTLYIRWHELDGMADKEIAERCLGITLATLRRWKVFFNLPRFKHKTIVPTGADDDRSLEYRARKFGYDSLTAWNAHHHAQGLTVKERAELLGCHPNALHRALRRAGAEPLPPLVTDRFREAARRHAERMNAARNNSKHIWRSL